jgi:chromosome segregation ATPase
MAAAQPSADTMLTQLMHNAAEEAQQPLNADLQAIKDDFKILKEQTVAQHTHQLGNLVQEADNYNSEVEGLKKSLRVLEEETVAHLIEELAKLTSTVDQDMEQKISEISETYARLDTRLNEVKERTEALGVMKKEVETEVKEELHEELKQELDTEIANMPHPASTEPLQPSEPPKRRRICFCF